MVDDEHFLLSDGFPPLENLDPTDDTEDAIRSDTPRFMGGTCKGVGVCIVGMVEIGVCNIPAICFILFELSFLKSAYSASPQP